MFRFACNLSAMDPAQVEYDGLDECIPRKMLSGYTKCKRIQVSCGHKRDCDIVLYTSSVTGDAATLTHSLTR